MVTFDPSGEGLAAPRGATGCVSNGGRRRAAPPVAGSRRPRGHLIVDARRPGRLRRRRSAASSSSTAPRHAHAAQRRSRLRLAAALAGCTTTSALGARDRAGDRAGRSARLRRSAAGRIATLRRDSSSPICANTAITVQHGFQGPIAIPCYDPDGDPLTFSTITPPTLGALGAFDHGAASVIYAAPQGQNGSTTIAFRATYTSFGTFIGDGSVQVNVVGAPVVLPGGRRRRPGRVHRRPGLPRRQPEHPAGRDRDQGQQHRRELRRRGRAVPDAHVGRRAHWSWKKRGTTFTLKTLQITQQFPKGWKVQIKCSGKKCPFKSKTLKAAQGQEVGVERDRVADRASSASSGSGRRSRSG